MGSHVLLIDFGKHGFWWGNFCLLETFLQLKILFFSCFPVFNFYAFIQILLRFKFASILRCFKFPQTLLFRLPNCEHRRTSRETSFVWSIVWHEIFFATSSSLIIVLCDRCASGFEKCEKEVLAPGFCRSSSPIQSCLINFINTRITFKERR